MWEIVWEDDDTMYYWNTISGKCISRLPRENKSSIQIRRDWRKIRESDGTIYYWDTISGECIPA